LGLRLSGGLRLQSPPGDQTRPTPARVRQAVMNMLAGELAGSRWLDLCCGSGVMACEALQRGAAAVVAVEQDRRIAGIARTNLEAVRQGLEPAPQAWVHTAEVLGWLARRPAAEAGFDWIYADPPYASQLYGAIAERVGQQGWLRLGGTLIWECDSAAVPAIPAGWTLRQQRRYGSTTVVLLQPASAAQHGAAPVLVPGRHEQAQQGDGDQTEHDAAEQGFDHGVAGRLGRPQFFHARGPSAHPSPPQ
jgi:16S rRNA (guanine966-N2)-methyltransferase